jgi:hypothetical protein
VTMQKIHKRNAGHDAAERRLVDQCGARPMRAGEKPAVWLRDAVRDDPTVGVILVQHGGCHRYLKPLGTRRQAAQVKINRELRPTGSPSTMPGRCRSGRTRRWPTSRGADTRVAMPGTEPR